MLLPLFTVYDSKVESYQKPFVAEHKGHAIRDLERVVNDNTTTIGQYPSDFTLFEIGSFDSSTGEIKMHEAKISLGVASQYVNKTPPEPIQGK